MGEEDKKPALIHCDICKFHVGVDIEIENIKDRQDKTNGAIQTLREAQNDMDKNKVSNKMFISFVTGSIIVLIALFSLLYNSQTALVDKVSDLNTSVAVLDQKTSDVKDVLNYFKEKREDGY